MASFKGYVSIRPSVTFPTVKYRLVSFYRALPQNDSQDFRPNVLPFLEKNGNYADTRLRKAKIKDRNKGKLPYTCGSGPAGAQMGSCPPS